MKTILTVSAILIGNALLAADQAKPVAKYTRITNEQERAEMMMRSFGGFVVRPGMKQGSFTVFNAQNELGVKEIEGLVRTLSLRLRIDVPIESIKMGGPTLQTMMNFKGGRNTEFALYIIRDPTSPVTTGLFPDQKFGYVNVGATALRSGRGEKQSFYVARFRKEFIRAFLSLCGASTSQTGINVMSPIEKIDDLDDLRESALPMDVVARVYNNLPKLGCNNRARTTYKKACSEGWAPAPTNEYQKAIWDKVHEIPKNPMKIEFDPKKGR